MILLPIGHEESTVRRLPWVTFALIGLNILFFIAIGLRGERIDKKLQISLAQLIQYWEEHPYLNFPWKGLPDTVAERIRKSINSTADFRQVFPHPPPLTIGQQEREQAKLNQMVAEFIESWKSHPLMKWGLIPAQLDPVTLITSLFMHSGWLHLIFNMLFLFLAGPAVEDCFGRPLFTALYLLAGIAGNLLHVAAFSHSLVPLVGASGAISGLMGAFLIRFAYTKIKLLYIIFIFLRPITGTFLVPAWFVLPLWLLQQVFFYLMEREGAVAYLAHIGGFLLGAGLAFTIKLFHIEERYIHPAIEKEISISQHPALDQGMDLLAKGDVIGARAAFGGVLAEDPRNPDANLAMWETYVQEKDAGNGGEFLIKVIDDEVKRQDIELARDHWRELVARARAAGPAAMRWRLATAIEKIDSSAAIEVLSTLVGDSSADVLAEKAVRRLESLGVAKAISNSAALNRVINEASPSLGTIAAKETPSTPSSGRLNESPCYGLEALPKVRWEVERCTAEGIQEEGIVISGDLGSSELLPFSLISAVTVAGVNQLPRPILIVDLVLGRGGKNPVKVVRLLSRDIDPRTLIKKPNLAPMEAFRQMVVGIASASGSRVVPESAVLPGGTIPTFGSIELYEAEVLERAVLPLA